MIVGIIKIGSGLIPLEEFRPATDLSSAVSSFCSEQAPPLDPIDYLGVDGAGIDYGKQWGWDFTNSVLVQIGWKDELVDRILRHKESRLETVILAEYPASSGKQFGCSVANQDSWSKLATLDMRSLVTYPFVIKTYDYQDSYAITDSTDLTAIIGTVSASVLAERTVSESYIDMVMASSTEAEASLAIAPYFS
jgi:hypothetical protein